MTDIAAWQKRLLETFAKDGVVGRGYAEFREDQVGYGHEIVSRFNGFMVLSESFLEFHVQLPALVNTIVLPQLATSSREVSHGYAVSLIRHTTDFRTLSASRELLLAGYPYEGFSLLRPVLDAALVRSAVVQGISTVERTEGLTALKSGEPPDYEAVRRARISEEKRIDRLMVGADSGLDAATIDELEKWEDLFHIELHGGRLSQTAALGWLKGKETFSFFPKFREKDAAMLMNRWVEIAWMVHRLMPAIQPPGVYLGDEWARRWGVLDESFSPIVLSLSTQLGKRIGFAINELVTKKFPFTATTTYPDE